MADFDHKIISRGNCMVCGKPIEGDNIFLCPDCINRQDNRQKKGKWLIDEERGADGIYMVCSNCDEVIYITGDFKFCPNCGADMRESDD